MTTTILRTLVGIYSLLCCGVMSYAQIASDSCLQQEVWRGAVYGGVNFNSHQTSFSGLPGIPTCCPHFTEGDGKGVAVGLSFALPMGQRFRFETRAEYSALDGTLKARQEEIADNNGVTMAVYEYSIASVLRSLAIIPTLRYSLWRVHVFGGVSLGYIAAAHFVQQEKLIAPDDLVYENGRRDRMNYAGKIPALTSLHWGLRAGLSAELPLNASGTMLLLPEVSAAMGMRSISSVDPWQIYSFRAGVSLAYSHRYTPAPVEMPAPVIPPPPAAPAIPSTPAVAKLELIEPLKTELVDDEGIRIQLPLRIKNTVSSNMYAMIHYIFFDSASAVIPARYNRLSKEEAQNFNPEKLKINTSMQIYYQILNLVGKRMQENSSIEITLTGCNTHSDAEKNNLQLSRERAEAVKRYLTEVWGIHPDRISVRARNLPAIASNSSTQDGIVENRRVEISSANAALLEPVIYSDTTRSINAARVRYSGKVLAESGIKEWRFVASQNGQDIKNMKGSGALPTTLAWNIKDDAMLLQANEKPVTIRLEVTDQEDKILRSPEDTLTLTHTTVNNALVQKYSLITFGFNTSNVSATDQHIIDIIKSNIKPTSKVSITGYTDRVGSAIYNQKLSLQRGLEIARMLGVDEKSVSGAGGGELLYDNNLPEGRFYCRTVMITIETPLD